MTVVLGLDCSKTSTGVAVGDASAPPRTFERRFDPAGSRGETYLGFMTFLRDMIAMEKPDVVVYEAALFMANARSSADSALLLLGLGAMTEMVCTSRRVAHYPIQVQTWRKDFLGHGRPDNAKMAALTMCASLGWEVGGSHDRAEAAGIWAAGHIRWGDRRRVIGLLSNMTVAGMEARVS